MSPRKGTQTALSKSPKIAKGTLSWAKDPIVRGNTIFPAPKNIENIANPVEMVFDRKPFVIYRLFI